MKTAIDWMYEALVESAKNEFTAEDLDRIFCQAKMIEKEQMRSANLMGWIDKEMDFDKYYSDRYENERSNINI